MDAADRKVPFMAAGRVRLVPASRVPLEELITRGHGLRGEISSLEAERDARGIEILRLIEAQETELEKLRQRLAKERAPVEAQVALRSAELEQTKAAIFAEIRPLMKEQWTFRYTGVAGRVEARRILQVEVLSGSKLRTLLGDRFPHYFRVQERVVALSSVPGLVQRSDGPMQAQLRQALRLTESGKVRFLRQGK